VTERSGTHMADQLAAEKHRLTAVQVDLGIVDDDAHDPVARGTLCLGLE
jgi:hypothetical protein